MNDVIDNATVLAFVFFLAAIVSEGKSVDDNHKEKIGNPTRP